MRYSWMDLRLSVRLLLRKPLFALTAALSLAIGIGANTAMFTVADALLMQSPPGVIAADRLVDIGRTQDGSGFDNDSYPNYIDVRDRTRSFSGVYAHDFAPRAMSLGRAGGADVVYGALATRNYFEVLGTHAAAGRLFTRSDPEQPGAAPIVVISHRLWTRTFDRDPHIAGRSVHLNGSAFVIAGVAEAGFRGTTLFAPDLWLPLNMVAEAMPAHSADLLTSRGSSWIMMGARLKDGVSLRDAQAELTSISAQLRREHPDDDRGRGLRAEPLAAIPGNAAPVRAFVGGLMIVSALVLAIACANIAGVLLARAALRRREMAVRIAIGAGRGQIVRQMLIETVVLFLPGAVLGLAFARATLVVLMSLIPALPLPVGITFGLGARAVAFAAALCVVAGVLSGLVPALQLSTRGPARALTSMQSTPERQRVRNVFVMAQVAASVVLLIIGALFLRALQRAANADPGFDANGIQIVSLDLSLGGYDDQTGPLFARQLLERVRAIPAVQSATAAALVPLGNQGLGLGPLTIPGREPLRDPVDWNVVDPEYFATLRIPLLRGRGFDAADRPGAPAVVIVNETMARRLWPGEDPIGKQLLRGGLPGERPQTLTVVGVARNAKYRTLGESPRMFLYVPLEQQPLPRLAVLIRTADAPGVTAAVRSLIASMNSNLPVLRTQSLDESAAIALIPQRIAAAVSGTFGAVGLLLAAIGIYGLTAFVVAGRTREIAIRTALGAERADILSMVLRQGLRLVAAGVVIGGLIAAAGGRLAASLLLGVGPADPIAFTAAALLCCAVGLAACWIPARRATRIEPTKALRWE